MSGIRNPVVGTKRPEMCLGDGLEVVLGSGPKLEMQEETLDVLMFMDRYVCIICGYVYDPAVGDPESGIAPGTAFEDIPDDWVCPLCGVGKEHFEKTS